MQGVKVGTKKNCLGGALELKKPETFLRSETKIELLEEQQPFMGKKTTTTKEEVVTVQGNSTQNMSRKVVLRKRVPGKGR